MVIEEIIRWSSTDDPDTREELTAQFGRFTALDRYVALAGLILWAGTHALVSRKGLGAALEALSKSDDIVGRLGELFGQILADPVAQGAGHLAGVAESQGDAGAGEIRPGGQRRRGAGAVQGEVRRDRVGGARLGDRRQPSRVRGRRWAVTRREGL